jgi:hypothetical protein
LGLHDRQLLDRWWIPGIVVAMAIGVVDSVFFVGRVRVDEIEKGKLGEVKE